MGAWISYGLGSLNDNLPTFVVLPDSRGYAPNGPANWGAGFLPAAHQGTMVRPGAKPPIFDLNAPKGSFATPESEADVLGAAQQAESQARCRTSRRQPARRPHRRLRAGRQASGLCAGSAGPVQGNRGRRRSSTAWTRRHRGVRPQLPDHPPAAGARRAFRPAVERRRQRHPAPQLGQPREHPQGPRRHGHEHGQADRRAASRI